MTCVLALVVCCVLNLKAFPTGNTTEDGNIDTTGIDDTTDFSGEDELLFEGESTLYEYHIWFNKDNIYNR